MKAFSAKLGIAAAVLGLALHAGPAAAEVREVKIAQQFGISYLPLMYLEHQKLLEKHAKAMGAGDVTVSWAKFAGGNVMNEALLSGSLHFASGGVGPLVNLWAKTKGNLDVKAVCAMNAMPLYLNTRNPDVKSIRDFTGKDKIALPAVKVSIQAVTLQMAAAKEFGEDKFDALDKFTVSMKHPDGMAALLSDASEITAHFTSPPFQYQELEDPKVRTLLSSFDVLGGPATFNVIWTTSKFRDENPKVYAAFLKAFDEAIDTINKDKSAAADNYIKWSGYKGSKDLIMKILNDPKVSFTMTPNNTTKYSDFLHKIGTIKVKPDSWKDMFFPEVHDLKGS
ncbi:MAG TPA: ABC transporter substrate-binding protein [Pelomicrobium sp.]|nr:ABC transporter substrate-binding protein [Pelomicrobium sp.]